MKQRNKLLTDYDKERLQEMLLLLSMSGKKYPDLEYELASADVISSGQIDKDVITMNSRVRIADLGRKQEFICQIVFPSDAEIDENKISVLSPVGTALLGCRVGDTIMTIVPFGKRNLKINDVLYQPEAAGHIYV